MKGRLMYEIEIWQNHKYIASLRTPGNAEQEITEELQAECEKIVKAMIKSGAMERGRYTLLLTDDTGEEFEELNLLVL